MLVSRKSYSNSRATTVLLLLFSATEVLPSKGSTPSSRLKWYLQGVNETTPTPFVTIENVLPMMLVHMVRNEIQESMFDGDPHDCTLRRDDLKCGAERWMDFTLQEAQQQTTILNSSNSIANDIFEQAVLHIARYDMLNILPPNVASQVAGVSWRVLQGISGENTQVFHYDSDEQLDYTFEKVPLIFPLLSTVTYLTNNGEPTLILEKAQLRPYDDESINDGSNLFPRAAYISMPATNKHIAFDSRLFHGSSAPISKNIGEYRIALGMNFHTHKSMESTHDEAVLYPDQMVAPLNLNSMLSKATILPWNPENLLSLEERNGAYPPPWQSFDLLSTGCGYDYCQAAAPCRITVLMPIQRLLENEDELNSNNGNRKVGSNEKGATVGFVLTNDDVIIESLDDDEIGLDAILIRLLRKKLAKPPNPNGREYQRALDMLRRRCDIFDHDLWSMNPPLLHTFCSSSNDNNKNKLDEEMLLTKISRKDETVKEEL